MKTGSYEMPSRAVVLRRVAEWFALPFLVLLLALAAVAGTPNMPHWFEGVLIGVGVVVAVLAVQQLYEWWLVKCEWPKAISGGRHDMARVHIYPEVLFFVRNPKPEWNTYCANFERRERVEQLLAAAPENVQDLRGESLRRVLERLKESLEVLPNPEDVASALEGDFGFELYEQVVQVLLYRLSEHIGVMVHGHSPVADDEIIVEARPRNFIELRNHMEEKYHVSWFGGYQVKRPRDVRELYTKLLTVIEDHENVPWYL